MIAASPFQFGRSQTGHTLQRDQDGLDTLQNETWLCERVAVRGWYAPLHAPSRTAISAATPFHRFARCSVSTSAGKTSYPTGEAA